MTVYVLLFAAGIKRFVAPKLDLITDAEDVANLANVSMWL